MIAYITGTSSGIGQALAEKLLSDGHTVFGLSRHQTIKHNCYTHITIDLADLDQVNKFEFFHHDRDEVILVNNAGIIGPVKPVGQHESSEITRVNNINVIAPQLLCNRFIKVFKAQKARCQILNISSGAGKRPIDAWSTYCASKAAIDLFSETMALELTERKYNNWHIYSISPGVVDTAMQSAIRSANPIEFLNHGKFVALKENNELWAPKKVANLLGLIIYNPENYPESIISLRDLV